MSASTPISLESSRNPLATTPGGAPARADDAAIRSLAAAIHEELRASLAPEDVVRLTAALLGRVTDELRARRV